MSCSFDIFDSILSLVAIWGWDNTKSTVRMCQKMSKGFRHLRDYTGFQRVSEIEFLRVGLVWDHFSGAVPSPESLRPAG